MAILDIRHLTIEINTPTGYVKAVNRVSLTINEGEIRGLVGESGSGKSLIAKALVGVTKNSWRITADRFCYNDIDLLSLSVSERRKLVGKEMGMIYQEPSSCLDPSKTIGRQLKQCIPHRVYSGKWWQIWKLLNWRHQYSKQLLHKVGIKNHNTIMRSYSNELTVGECQQVMIAMALSSKPKLLIADEPTNDIDSISQAQIFRLLKQANQLSNTTILLISHDLNNITKWVDKITVMYCGQSIESGTREQIAQRPHHPYTAMMLETTFNDSVGHKQKLKTLPGATPLLEHLPIGCRLGPRCPYAQKKCIIMPHSVRRKGHKYSCHFPLNIEETTP